MPHSHWDREWYLTFDEFRGMLVNMIDDLIEILERDPKYKSFLLDGQTSVLEDYLEVRPERREKLMQMIAAKRMFVGPWYVLPDSFLVSGEALIRNLLRGTQTASRAGADRYVGYIPDSFGHTGQLPQIFRGFGIDTAIFWRGFGGEPGQEGSEYRWESPNGSWVLAEHLNDQGYSGAYFDSDDPEKMLETFNGIRKRLDARTEAGARLMLSGGDHHWPVERLSRVIQLVSEHLGEGATAVHSNLIEFFDDLKASVDIETLPTIVGEQRFGYRWAFNVTGGVYSSRIYLKQANARCQRMLEGYLERLDAIAASRGLTTQGPLLRLAWATLLQNHPHDSICGCSTDMVHREMETRFEKVENTGRV
ncbi:MAG: alpha-mannosidase, partial [Rhodothermia bacterium]